MKDVILILILLSIILPSLLYIVKAKKKNQRCIGCCNSSTCNKVCNCSKDEDNI